MCFELIELSYGFKHAGVLYIEALSYILTHTPFYVYIVHYVLGCIRSVQGTPIRNNDLSYYNDSFNKA